MSSPHDAATSKPTSGTQIPEVPVQTTQAGSVTQITNSNASGISTASFLPWVEVPLSNLTNNSSPFLVSTLAKKPTLDVDTNYEAIQEHATKVIDLLIASLKDKGSEGAPLKPPQQKANRC